MERSAATDYDSTELYDSALGDYTTTVIVSSTVVPDSIKDAVSELALYLLEKDTTAPTGQEGITEIKVDSIQLKFDAKDRLGWLNPSVKNLVWRFMANASTFNAPTTRVG